MAKASFMMHWVYDTFLRGNVLFCQNLENLFRSLGLNE